MFLHMLWPGDLERYVLPHAVVVFYLFGASIDWLCERSPRLTFAATLPVLIVMFFVQYPSRILDEATRSNPYSAASVRLSREKGDFTVLGADHAAIELLSGHFAFSAWHQLGRPAYILVAELIRTHRLRYQIVTNYFHIDDRFKELREPREIDVLLPDGWRLHYRPMFISAIEHWPADAAWFGLLLETRKVVHEAVLYEVGLLPP